MTVYNKLVRDGILDDIQKSGNEFEFQVLEDGAFEDALHKKLQEEVEEVISAEDNESTLEELSDVLEVVKALADLKGSSLKQLEEMRRNKVEEKGAFKERFYLIDVLDGEEEE
ncbi:phosphoribosyl-ATP pyrophosphohydrolase [Pontibacillus halophilus JSM 076056 = DSM 19796]|uniref:Phosphoribosyl-ATP pyrophosphohydrolase n=1 Tax=Pontibacillus halophilus JSM 076056 = DSM 19796 TaxID=1385510 RepID=A0A0A5I947_9BACI|nr:nucleoside triphosphate pyrophosphohydrolase [Pontibacillus halophilus]KGX92362.1 phosphoribosyl-ATP pyrophosphohydrolase [Pontibacillus halophilus JSM 076056 = DSM 19796]